MWSGKVRGRHKRPLEQLFAVAEYVAEHVVYMLVGKAVMHVPSVLPGCNQPGAAQRAELVAYGRLSHIQRGNDLVHTHLTVPKKAEYFEARWIRETLEKQHCFAEHTIRWQTVAELVNTWLAGIGRGTFRHPSILAPSGSAAGMAWSRLGGRRGSALVLIDAIIS